MLYLLPSSLSDDNIACIPNETLMAIKKLRVFFVEDLRTARRFLRRVDSNFDIDNSQFFILNEHENSDVSIAETFFKQNMDIGLLSDCGCPAVADPGKKLVELAHQHEIIVKPLVGPNSILLTLMASGFNGQSFSFEGYLPNKQPALDKKLIQLENQSRIENRTILFIETPYRNNQLKDRIVQKLHPDTALCIAANLTAQNEHIVTKKIKDWKRLEIDFHKQPAVFAIYAGY